jgi:Helix-hairpin-helix domain
VAVQPEPAGDLTRIPGIGSRIAAQLRDAGIRTVDQLAQATVQEVVAACGSRVATNDRARAWIEQARRLAADVASGGGHEPARGTHPLPRRTFTLEVRVGDDPAHVVATRVVHLETKDADTWPGWSRDRLFDFLETRIGAAEPETGEVAAEPASAAAAVAPEAVESAIHVPSPAPLVVHRFGLLKAAAPAISRGELAARLRLNPADLDLPSGGIVMAQVELLARPVGAGPAQVVDARVLQLVADRALDVLLRGRLPGRDPPFVVSAAVRVLVDQPSGQARKGLGNGTLELQPPEGPAA